MNFKKFRDVPVYHYIGIGALVLLIFFQMSNFMTAFRITADDVRHYLDAMKGDWQLWLEESYHRARGEGRISYFYLHYYYLLSSYLMEFTWFKYFLLLQFVMYSVGSAWWLSRFAGKQIAFWSVLLFFVMVPVGLNHWPPNSFGYLMLIFSGLYLCRLALWYVKNKYWEYFFVFLSILIVLSGEFNLLLYILILIMEYKDVLWDIIHKKISLKKVFQRREIRRDLFILVMAWGIYGSFRLLFPPTYKGMKANLSPGIMKILSLQWKHIFSGLSLGYITSIPLGRLLSAWYIGLLTILALLYAFRFPSPRNKQIFTGIFWGFWAAFIPTFLIAISAKYQEKCWMRNVCSYLDSRLAMIGVTALVASIFAFLFKKFRTSFATLLGGGLAIIAMATYVHNKGAATYVKRFDIAYELSKKYLCLVEDTDKYDKLFIKGVQQVRYFSYNKYTDINLFWKLHLQNLRKLKNFSCSENLIYSIGQKLNFTETGRGSEFLIFGWSHPEKWGTWSDGDSALVLLKLKEKPGKDLLLIFNLSPYVNKNVLEQKVIIQFFDIPIDTIKLTKKKAHTVHIKISKQYFSDNFLPLLLKFPNAISPVEAGETASGDHRKLGIMLHSLKLEEETIKNE